MLQGFTRHRNMHKEHHFLDHLKELLLKYKVILANYPWMRFFGEYWLLGYNVLILQEKCLRMVLIMISWHFWALLDKIVILDNFVRLKEG